MPSISRPEGEWERQRSDSDMPTHEDLVDKWAQRFGIDGEDHVKDKWELMVDIEAMQDRIYEGAWYLGHQAGIEDAREEHKDEIINLTIDLENAKKDKHQPFGVGCAACDKTVVEYRHLSKRHEAAKEALAILREGLSHDREVCEWQQNKCWKCRLLEDANLVPNI